MKIVSLFRRAALHTLRLKSQSLLIAFSTAVLAFLALFSLLLFQCAVWLDGMTNLPYLDRYLFCSHSLTEESGERVKDVSIYGERLIEVLPKYEIVEDVIFSRRVSGEAPLCYITPLGEKSEAFGTFYWTVLPQSNCDDSFLKGERILTAGRHLTMEDYRTASRCIMMDEILAKVNRISVGDTVKVSEEELYTVVGLFQTVKQEAMSENYAEIPQNLLLASVAPTQSENRSGTVLFDVYVKFRSGASQRDIDTFLAFLAEKGFTGSNYYNRYELLSVAELNRMNKLGIRTAYNIASISVAAVGAVAICAVYSFIDIMLRTRQRELLLYKALGEKKHHMIFMCVLECLYVTLPSVAIGATLCAVLCRDTVHELFLAFATRMTPDSLSSTSSLWLSTRQNVTELIADYVSLENVATVAVFVCAILLTLATVCIMGRVSAILRQKTISLLSERRD